MRVDSKALVSSVRGAASAARSVYRKGFLNGVPAALRLALGAYRALTALRFAHPPAQKRRSRSQTGIAAAIVQCIVVL